MAGCIEGRYANRLRHHRAAPVRGIVRRLLHSLREDLQSDLPSKGPHKMGNFKISTSRSKIIYILSGIIILIFGMTQLKRERQELRREGGLPGIHFMVGGPLKDLPANSFDRVPLEGELDFAQRLPNLIHQSTYNCSPSDFELSFIDFALSRPLEIIASVDFGWHEGLLVEEVMLCGFCHQRAFFLTDHLIENNVDAMTLGLSGHVVTLANIEGTDYLLDPDYGATAINYNLFDEELRVAVFDGYSQSAFDNSAVIFPMIASRDDNFQYYEHEYLQGISERQRLLFRISDVIALALVAIGVTTAVAPIVGAKSKLPKWSADSHDARLKR